MNETKVYYRVLNEEEIIGEFWNSIEDLTSHQQMTQEYYPQIEANTYGKVFGSSFVVNSILTKIAA